MFQKEMSFSTVQLLLKRLARFFFCPQNIIQIQFSVPCMAHQYSCLKDIVPCQFARIIINGYRKACVISVPTVFCICIMLLCIILCKSFIFISLSIPVLKPFQYLEQTMISYRYFNLISFYSHNTYPRCSNRL